MSIYINCKNPIIYEVTDFEPTELTVKLLDISDILISDALLCFLFHHLSSQELLDASQEYLQQLKTKEQHLQPLLP
jgi:hypothetical protein